MKVRERDGRGNSQGKGRRTIVTAVLDASVILKWLLRDPIKEPETVQATQLLEAVTDGRLAVLQPIHWIVDVAAVLAGLSPQTAIDDVSMLVALQLPTFDERYRGNAFRHGRMVALRDWTAAARSP